MSSNLKDFPRIIHFTVQYSFDSLRNEFASIIMYNITIFFYFFVFGTIINNIRPKEDDYLTFFVPGLIILTIIGSITSMTLKFWYNASVYNLMSYWLSLPASLEHLLYLFTFNTLLNSLIYSFPLLAFLVYLKFSLISILQIILLILLGSLLFYYLLFFLVLKMFNSNFFYIIQQTGQPILTRLSPVFYKIIFIPVVFLPLVYINPFTWIVLGMRNLELGGYIIILMVLVCIVLFKFVIRYWNMKIKEGSLIH